MYRKEAMKKIQAKPESRTKTADWKQLVVRIPPDVHHALKVRAAEEGRSIAVLVEGLVRGYLVGKRA